ncbi:hypothetical protein AB0I28_21905 [Phytomonospora sp. NPDC050363]|uniref:SecDF P1 head subdomain-containing protein n=1 Tax=Phytomonospora sp. NPDC050363 TaxID=3155642 RepID=UPI0033FEB17B
MKKTIAVFLTAGLLAATGCSEAEQTAELEYPWPTQAISPDAVGFRAVVAQTDGTVQQGLASEPEAGNLDELWAKVGTEAADLARSLTAPAALGGSGDALAPFAGLSPAEVELLPPEVAFNVPYIHCGQLADLPRQYPDAAAQTAACDSDAVKYLLDPRALNGGDLAEARIDTDINTGGYKIILEFTAAGADRWAAFTTANVGNQVALLIGDEVLTAPSISGPIVDSTTEITGEFTLDEAEEIISRMRAALTD